MSGTPSGPSPDLTPDPPSEPTPDPATPPPPASSPPQQTLARSGLIMASGTMASRVLGLLRQVLLAGVIGSTGLTADVFQVANTLPNNFYALIAGGMLNAVLVPQIVGSLRHDDGGERFVNRIITLALALLAAATALTMALGGPLITLFASFSDPAAQHLATVFAWICLPQIFFYGLYSILGQVLNARGVFGPYMWAPVLANVVAIVGLLAFRWLGFQTVAPAGEWTPGMVAVLGGSATLSIALQALALLIPLRRIGFRYRPVWGIRGSGLGTASTVALWTTAAVTVSQIGFVVTSRALTRAAGFGAETHQIVATRASFDNAFLIFMLPHSLVTVSLVTALFTRMSRASRSGDRTALLEDLRRGLRLPAPFLVPGVTLAVALAPLVTATFFFNRPLRETEVVAVVVGAMLLGVIPYGWSYILERVFFARDDGRTPFLVQCSVTGVALAAALVAFTHDPRRSGAIIGYGQAAAYVIGAVLLLTLVRRALGPLGLARTVRTYADLLAPSVLSALGIAYAVHLLSPRLAVDRPLGLVVLGVAGVVHLTVVWTVGAALGVGEIRALLAPVLRRLGRSAPADA